MDSLPRSHFTRSRTAWLGLLAMCMVVFAPLVSQSLMALRMGQARIQAIEHQLCSADSQDAAAMRPHTGHTGTQDGPMSACGYCNFLAGHAALPVIPAAALALVLLMRIASVAMPAQRHIACSAFPSGRPRGPPVFPRLTA
ncbi:DUF2946 domain-containing protein [Bordetella sp. FB-8]|uniref:DUF2946 domain-containing protein n=1 Tax=Bordetella sp. FB-8 TaxID=1159870 RepID=UPI000378F9DD|nr:DUF2946 domain-containing protein [Bordetella sp. FB-8]